ncbi:MAG: hypothetical protein HUK07_01685 [Bacteroidaceae bacterium]|nr:hypothetical protein [Bacteroidaceae bacterium]
MNSKKQTYSAPMCAVHTLSEEMSVICAGSSSGDQGGKSVTTSWGAPTRMSITENEFDDNEDYE